MIVEEQELAYYKKAFGKDDPDHIVWVSIPGKDRGIGFARTMTKILQETLREKIMEEEKCLFN